MFKLAAMTSVCPDWGVEEIIEGMKGHGYEGLEPRVGWGHAAGIELDTSPKEREAIRSKVENAGLKICCVATGARFATEDADALKGYIDEADAAIDLAADLGAGVIRTFGGARGKGQVFWMVHRTAEAYKRVMDHAANRGVTVLMETHDEWCVSAQVRAVVEKVNHPNMGVLWDMMHTQRFMEKTEETMQTIGHLARHLHAHDGRFDEVNGPIETVGLGEGVIDHTTPLKLLNASGFEGYFSVEVIHKPGSDHDAEGTFKQYSEGFRSILEAI
jgi:sugar phosphate isomerase/epimerase